MKARDLAVMAPLLVLSTPSACGQPGVEEGGPAPATPTSDGAEVPPAARAQPEVRRLAADERRVRLIVLPADAAVEVDGVPVRRRDGIVELTGKVGETRRVRLSRDAQHVETAVTIEGAGASPPALDLAALARAARPLGRGRLPAAPTAPTATPAAPEPAATAEPAHESTLPEAMRASATGSEAQACVCPPAPEVVVYRCPNGAAAGAAGKKPKGVLAGDSFE